MMNRMRISAKVSAISRSALKQGNPNPVTLLSSIFHSSNQETLRRPYPYIVFEDITSLDDALSLFHRMIKMRRKASILDYNKLLNIIVKMEHYSQVIVMFKKMSLLGSPVNEYTMNIVINCYCNMKQVGLSFAIVASFVKRGYGPDVVTFTCLIRGLFLEGKVVEAVDLFNDLIRGKLCEVNEFTIAAVLDGLSKSGYIVNAVQLLEMSEKNNWKLDVFSYSAVIDGLCKCGMLKDGMELLFRMIDRDVHPNVVTYNIFLYGLCNHGRLDLARSIFNDLPSKGISPDVITYTVMIQGLCRNRLFRDAKEMLDEMEGVGCVPNSVTYNVIIQACLHNRNRFDSIDLLKQIVGRDFQLDAPSFFVLLGQIQELPQMQGIYDDDVINHFMRKLTSSGSTHKTRNKNDGFIIPSWVQI